jgi:methionyl-tRNA formyltransferase
MARVQWTGACEAVCRTIRAYDPRPGAFTTLDGIDVKLFGPRLARSAQGEPGEVLSIDESGMLVACTEGGVRIAYVHPAGKRRLAALDWAQGRGVKVGDQFGTTAPSVP